MNRTEQANQIAQVPLFASLPLPELEHLANALRQCEFSTGALLMQEGESDDLFYILLDGEAEIIKAIGTPDERQLAVLGCGTLLGEMSLFNPEGSHTASVKARTTIRALEMTRQEFEALLHRFPSLVFEVMRRLSHRLEESENATILDLREKNLQLTQAYQELQAAQAQLIEKERLEKELAIARQIQESILPDILPQPDGYEFAALSYPARAVGGDYYDIFRLKGGRYGVVVGDACDKGIPAALYVTLANSLVHVEARRSTKPEQTLRAVNRHLIDMNRSGMFITLLYGILDPNTGRFDYCRAGHPHPLVLDGTQRPVNLDSNAGMPLGVMAEIVLDAQTVTIPPGGLALIYSDGLSEVMDASGSELGPERLAARLPGLSHLPAKVVCGELWNMVQEFSGGQPQSDDFTVVVIKRAV